jgi:hypothetical protein
MRTFSNSFSLMQHPQGLYGLLNLGFEGLREGNRRQRQTGPEPTSSAED